MIRFFVVLIVVAAVSSSAFSQTVYILNAAGSGDVGDVLGGSQALKASEFYEFMKTNWKIPTVEPTIKAGVITNVPDLVPYEVIVVPELVTIHTSQARGSQYDFNRQNHGAVSPLPVTVNPAEDSVFVYALNREGKLIYPFVVNNTGDGSDYVSTYSIQPFQEHSNFPFFYRPIVANNDVDITGSYNKDKPNMNPPNAIMFRGRAVGRYALSLFVRFNNQLLSVSNSTADWELAKNKVISKTVEVNVIDGPETIDLLLFNSSKNLGIHDASKRLSFSLQAGEELDVSLSGRKVRKAWKTDSMQYKDDGVINVMLKQANWSYSNLVQKADFPFDQDLLFIRKLTADGTSVHIVANKLPTNVTEGKGTITIESHGRQFDIDVIVKK